MPGPAPNHSSDLSRERDANRGDRPELKHGEKRPVTIPHGDKDWHPAAVRLYNALKTSGQSDFYQNSDWAFAWSLCDDLSDYKNQGRRSAQMAATIYSAFTSLLVTEGDRRRARIELTDAAEEKQPASVAAMDRYRKGVYAVKNEEPDDSPSS